MNQHRPCLGSAHIVCAHIARIFSAHLPMSSLPTSVFSAHVAHVVSAHVTSVHIARIVSACVTSAHIISAHVAHVVSAYIVSAHIGFCADMATATRHHSMKGGQKMAGTMNNDHHKQQTNHNPDEWGMDG